MGNQPEKMSRRERANTADGHYIRPRVYSSVDEECPVQMKMPKEEGKTGTATGADGAQPPSNTPSMQFENATELPVVVKWTGGGQPKAVAIAGSWDGWARRIPLVKSHEDFSTIIELPEGRHEFKFMVDSQWVCDGNLPKTDNKLGTQNNVISVDKGDFQVFDALAKDMESTDAGKAKKGNAPSQTESVNERELEKNLTFTQRVPDRGTFERAHHPPVLPPHLLQVILNKDTPVQCDPNVLPEPNHVMLNHLYALSIKDGVMVLSATHRYRRKYVTTLLYKPIDS